VSGLGAGSDLHGNLCDAEDLGPWRNSADSLSRRGCFDPCARWLTLFETIFPVILGALVWTGVFVRDAQLRQLIPLRR
jgi:hypothetical protein